MRKLKQRLIIPMKENEMLARQILTELAQKIQEEKEWTVELGAGCDDLLRTTRIEKANRMKYAFLLGQKTVFMEKVGYEEGVAGKLSEERKEKAARNKDVKMRVTEVCVHGTKRKAMRKETTKEKAGRDRTAKRRLIDGL